MLIVSLQPHGGHHHLFHMLDAAMTAHAQVHGGSWHGGLNTGSAGHHGHSSTKHDGDVNIGQTMGDMALQWAKKAAAEEVERQSRKAYSEMMKEKQGKKSKPI